MTNKSLNCNASGEGRERPIQRSVDNGKRCCVCEQVSEDFSKNSARCRPCAAAKFKEWYAKNREQNIAKAIVRNRAAQPKYRAEFPERYEASKKLNVALRYGRVKRLLCFVCGDTAEAHHPDYSRPLDVVWLCPMHHKQTHALVENATTSR